MDLGPRLSEAMTARNQIMDSRAPWIVCGENERGGRQRGSVGLSVQNVERVSPHKLGGVSLWYED